MRKLVVCIILCISIVSIILFNLGVSKEESVSKSDMPIGLINSSSEATTALREVGFEPTKALSNKTELDTALGIIKNATEGKVWTTGLYVDGVRYNCGDFTKASLLALRNNGYNETTSYALCNEGLKSGGWHYWIGIILENGTAIEIEPQNNKIIINHYGIYSPWGRRCVVRGIW